MDKPPVATTTAGALNSAFAVCHAELVAAADLANLCVQEDADARRPALFFQHGDDLSRRTVAKQLAQRLLVIADAMLFDERNEIGWRVARQSRLGEVRISTEKVFGPAVNVGEIAAPAAGNQDLLAQSGPRAQAPRRGVRACPPRWRTSGRPLRLRESTRQISGSQAITYRTG